MQTFFTALAIVAYLVAGAAYARSCWRRTPPSQIARIADPAGPLLGGAALAVVMLLRALLWPLYLLRRDLTGGAS